MDHNNSSFRDRPAHPPGTVELFGDGGHGGNQGTDGKMILMPTPSDDPDDPLSWSMFRKSWNYGLLTAMTMAIFTALGVQPVFWPQMLEDMDVQLEDLTNAQAAQLVGLAAGCVVFIPFAKKYGRRPVYIISTALVMASIWWSAFMNSATEVYLTNVLLGLAGATNETAVQMSIRDLFFVHQRGSANGIYLMAVTCGTFLTPMAAGAQAFSSRWRSSYVTLAVFMTLLNLLFVFTFEETKFVPVIGGGVPDGDGGVGVRELAEFGSKLAPVESEMPIRDDDEELRAARRRRKPFPRYLRLQLVTRTDESLWQTFWQPVHVAWFPHVVWTYLEFASGVCWFVIIASVSSIAFSKPPYNFNPAQIGFMNAGPLVGSIFGSLYGGWFVDWAIVRFARRNGGLFEPEMRLWLTPLPAILMSAGLVVYGVTVDRGMHFIYPSIGGALFAAGFGGISDISFTLVIDAFPNLVSLTFVVIAFFRNAISIAGPFSITPWMEKMSIGSIFIIAGSISMIIHFTGLPILFWGKRMRRAMAPRYYRLSQQTS
ncbi:hypothetical protein CDD83_1958 [Cordyceps sp. RAO-2017]|nr:hypothetical protein CDD83_1958 [Cordyceps sp. RAO-2017]